MGKTFQLGSVVIEPSEIISGPVAWTHHDVHMDDRGSLTEAAIDSVVRLLCGEAIEQVNVSLSKQNVLRGLHFHRWQWDFWYVAEGVAQVVIWDGTLWESRVLTKGKGVVIPPMKGHGFYAAQDLTLIYAVTEPYDQNDPDEATANAGEYTEWMVPVEETIRSQRDKDADFGWPWGYTTGR